MHLSSNDTEGTPPQTTSQPDDGLQVNSLRDMHTLCSICDSETGAYKRSVFTFIDSQDFVYFGQASVQGRVLSPEDLRKALERVPDDDIYPEAPPHITTTSISTGPDVYIKRPKLNVYDAWVNTGLLAKLFLAEAEVLEVLNRKPHPNIIRYHGCIVKRGRITGIVLDRCHETLTDRLKDGAGGFDVESCMERVRSGVGHLHSLGYAHNDINPNNIMVGQDDTPTIVDFSSCQLFGKDLITGGTPGWIDEYFTTSERRHDEIALEKLWVWLKEK
jgi:serine/threonine protein kinase